MTWLVDQLPRVMSADPVLHDLVLAFEEVADTVRERIDNIEYQMDTGLASPEMLQFLGSWLGVELEPTDPAEYRRSMVREVGRLLGWRGTRFGVEALLEAATGARVTVNDSGGVFGRNDTIPPADPVVVVQMDHTGHLTDEIRGEDPAGHRRRDQRLAGAAGQPGEPLPDDQPDAFRYRRLGDLEVRSGLGQMQVQLVHEERVTLRLAVDDPHQLLWRRLSGQGLNHGPDAPEGQSAQADPVDQPPTAELINHA